MSTEGYSRAPRFAGKPVWTPKEGWTDAPACGYLCKFCGEPSPIGVGYADHSEGAYERSAGLTSCLCGVSVKP
jgi:hypothetical protein